MYEVVQIQMPKELLAKSGRKGSEKVSALLDTLTDMPVGNAFYVNTITDEEMEKTQRRIYNAQSKVKNASKQDGKITKDFQIIVFQGADVDKAKALFNQKGKPAQVVGPGWGVWRVK